MNFPKPDNETKRVVALQRYKLLDTDPEKSFDDFSRLASYICETPIALITLVDENRQWFKSKVGLEGSETPREQSFCSHAVFSGRTLVVENALEDVRFAENPSVIADPHIRFYAGAPLIDHDGYALGSLCVIDRKPRQLKKEQILALEVLARQVTTMCEFRRVSSELHLALEEIKVLQGLLPICMHCKSIRNDLGFWRSLEEYISSHSEASFTHGLCVPCLKLHYPEVYTRMVEKGDIQPI